MIDRASIDIFFKEYFPNLDDIQLEKLYQLGQLYIEWNSKVNLISRKDIENVYRHHILHSCAIARLIDFAPGTKILDLGTGGGLPGIPLAILFPEVKFHLVDGRSKKIMVVKDIVDRLQLSNARAQAIRAEEIKNEKYDFIVSRAVAPLEKLYLWSHRLIRNKEMNGLPNGLLCLKGGDIEEEISVVENNNYVEVFPISDFFSLDYYQTKQIVYVQA